MGVNPRGVTNDIRFVSTVPVSKSVLAIFPPILSSAVICVSSSQFRLSISMKLSKESSNAVL